MQKIFVSVCLMVVALIAGCSQPHRTQPVVVQIQQPQVQYVELTVIEGKTTKSEILEALGTPDAFDKFHIAYNYYKRSPYEGLKIQCTQKDGSRYAVMLRYGTKNTHISFYIRDDGILDYVSL